MIEKITLDMLTQDSVSVKRQSFMEYMGEFYPIGNPHRKSYINNEQGRLEIQEELPQAQQDAIFAVWGERSTVE